jgi:4-hydroxymandelate oxidase
MDTVDFDALEERAKAILKPGAFAFGAAGADDEITAKENVAAWRALRLRPRVLRDVVDTNTRTTILGEDVATPIMFAPTGRHKLFHPEAELASARGTAAAGAVYLMSTYANLTVETVASERRAASQWFQLYYWRNRDEVAALIERVAAAGFSALVLNVDSPVAGWSPRAAREQYEPRDDVRNVNIPGAPIARTAYHPDIAGKVLHPATWHDLEWLVAFSPLPVVIKGVLRGDDAVTAAECGARGVIVSNHGGRYVDTAVTTAAALMDVAAAVAGRTEIYVDGGIRRGTDIIKAFALGARGVLIGRPAIWGLSVDGAAGVTAVFEHLRTDLIRAMQLCGLAKLSEITPDFVTRV